MTENEPLFMVEQLETGTSGTFNENQRSDHLPTSNKNLYRTREK